MEGKSLSYDTALNNNAMHLLKIDIVLAAPKALPGRFCSVLQRRGTLGVNL